MSIPALRVRFAERMARHSRKGNVLLEFSLIVLVVFMLLAFTMDFGRAVYSAQAIEQAADHIARELAVMPLPAQFDLDPPSNLKLGDPAVNKTLKDQGIYSEDYLVIDLSKQGADQYLLDYLDILPIPSGNRLLVPLMMTMDSTQNPNIPAGTKWLVYPGAIVPSKTGSSPTGFTVRIPTVQYQAGGVEAISPQDQWLHVVEVDDASAFLLTSPQRGIASVRVNYPFQAAAVSGRFRDPNNPDAPPQTAQDAYIEAKGDELKPGQIGGPYTGQDGLGQQAAFTKTVRPFRRIVSGQGVYRREVFP
jgi:hypothetical protein